MAERVGAERGGGAHEVGAAEKSRGALFEWEGGACVGGWCRWKKALRDTALWVGAVVGYTGNCGRVGGHG
eukprot:4855189-Pleurochrysis_carterae.AAC.1